MQDTERRYITVPEAGRMLGVGRAQAYAHAAAGRIPTVRLGRKMLVPVRALTELEDAAARSAIAVQEQLRDGGV
jgi:excisionase family DNA binding protein